MFPNMLLVPATTVTMFRIHDFFGEFPKFVRITFLMRVVGWYLRLYAGVFRLRNVIL